MPVKSKAKKWTKARLREIAIFNSDGLSEAAGGAVYLVYRPQDAYTSAAWLVIGPQGRSYSVWRHADKQARLDAAKAWSAKVHGITGWERDPFGGWHPEGTMARLHEPS